MSLLGVPLEWLIQQWIQATGRPVQLAGAPWLAGPVGDRQIGAEVYERFASASGLSVTRGAPGAGLLPAFDDLRGPAFAPERVDAEVRRFYERTSEYAMDVWSQWHGLLQPFARGLVALVSRSIRQFNLPLSPLDTSRGMGSEIIQLVDRRSGRVAYTGWLRTSLKDRSVVYAGFYTTASPPGAAGACVKVVFPLPRGASVVLLRPENQDDGSLKLISGGAGFGGPGYYRVHQTDERTLRVRFLPLHETIHVYRDPHGVLRTDHTFRYWGMPFLTLHYKIVRKP